MNLLMPASAHLDQPVAAAGDQLAAALPAEGQHARLVTLQLPHALRRAATLPSSGVLLSAAQYLVTLTSARLHIRTTASPPPVATRRSAGLKAAHHTPRV